MVPQVRPTDNQVHASCRQSMASFQGCRSGFFDADMCRRPFAVDACALRVPCWTCLLCGLIEGAFSGFSEKKNRWTSDDADRCGRGRLKNGLAGGDGRLIRPPWPITQVEKSVFGVIVMSVTCKTFWKLAAKDAYYVLYFVFNNDG